MPDPILEGFLRRQEEEVRDLGTATDGLVEVLPIGGSPPDRYVLNIRAWGLVQDESGGIEDFEGSRFGIVLGADHLRSVDAARVIAYLGPHPRPFHPQIAPPFVCLHVTPGMGLRDLVHALYSLWTYQLFETRDDGLNRGAAQWARNNPSRLPVDGRPLVLRKLA